MFIRVKSNWQNWSVNPELPDSKVPSTARPWPLHGAQDPQLCPSRAFQLGISCCRGSARLSQASCSVSSRSAQAGPLCLEV